jgi:hypothetical protein
VTVDDDLEALYGVPPEEFMALRKNLVSDAKTRGDADGAKVIGAARRPTTAAWLVNQLVRREPSARTRLSELTDALRTAHASMDGPRIRELTAVQRRLLDDLVRTAFGATGYADPTAAVRNDVTDTLQAAIADPDVAARLGRLVTAERWSGFGDYGEVAAVARKPVKAQRPAQPEQSSSAPDPAAVAAARQRVDSARVDVDTAAHARTAATDLVSERSAKLATARRRYEKLLESLSAAEREVEDADSDLDAAELSVRTATGRLDAANGELAHAEAELQRLAASTDKSS